ncbi:methylated-DNA--[protein]-cysteine S-methyltransferase [uncultured Arthrobacter sp.]|uniref:methylated-DNA--[protein]-cysteine S-methyltransferase n=1 Tax=uncultured Arthrobacter sp. TaxID=114050 RepID=UPI0026021D00|nr:methylated-DNA--[protein]-cysteine S-methyltransferase [uncultured Arthrobacter sp.]
MSGTSGPDTGGGRWHQEIETPVGGLLIVADAAAIVGLYHSIHDPAPGPELLGRRLRVPGSTAEVSSPEGTPGPPATLPPMTADLLGRAAEEVAEYFAGARQEFELPVELHGTEFQLQVWADVLTIPYGERRSYRDLASRQGNSAMGRAIGAAVRANPVSILVPGHRVVSSTGGVAGYASGSGTKIALLELESATRLALGTLGAGSRIP